MLQVLPALPRLCDSVAEFGGRLLDHKARATTATKTANAAAANEKLSGLTRVRGRNCARFHTPTKLGAACWSASLSSLNSAWIFFSSPTNSIINFRPFQDFAQAFLPAFVVLPRAADRNAHHVRGFAQAEVFIKDQVQSFSLASRQMLQREPKSHLLFRAIKSRVNFAAGGFAFADLLGAYRRSQLAQQVPAILGGGGLANHRKQPRLQAGLAAESRFAFKDLQIDRLQNFFGFPSVPAQQLRAQPKQAAWCCSSSALSSAMSIRSMFTVTAVFSVLVA